MCTALWSLFSPIVKEKSLPTNFCGEKHLKTGNTIRKCSIWTYLREFPFNSFLLKMSLWSTPLPSLFVIINFTVHSRYKNRCTFKPSHIISLVGPVASNSDWLRLAFFLDSNGCPESLFCTNVRKLDDLRRPISKFEWCRGHYMIKGVWLFPECLFRHLTLLSIGLKPFALPNKPPT